MTLVQFGQLRCCVCPAYYELTSPLHVSCSLLLCLPQFALLLLLCLSSFCWADLPIDCRFSDAIGTWMITETGREFDSSIDCSDMGDVVYRKNFTLKYPNLVIDELGFTGTWTLVINQGFEININERSYYSSFHYEIGGSPSYDCSKLHTGWAHDYTVRHWSCFTGTRLEGTKSSVREFARKKESPALDEKFVNDEDFIRRLNAAQDSWTARAYPENEKYTNREMLQRAGGTQQSLPPPAPATQEQKAKVMMLPSHFDWRDAGGVNYVSPVRDQGQCGSCYSFASTGLVEARVRIETNNTRQDIFSNQDVLSCSTLSESCDGGWPYLTAGRYAKDFGFVQEACSPYTAMNGVCDTASTCSRTYVNAYEYVGGYYGACNEEVMMEALVTRGPLTVAYFVFDDFRLYSSGIYHHVESEKTDFEPFYACNHAVLVVGYGVEASTGEKFWSVKNSWGGSFGEDGYFRIRRGTNECGIESAAFDATVIS